MPVFDVNVSGDEDPAEKAQEIYKKYCVQACRFRVKWKDIFNVKEYYRAMHEWFLEHGWKDMEDEKDHYETLYFEKVGLNQDKELWNRWRVQKKPDRWYTYHIDLDFHYLYLVPTEIVHEGKKLKKDIYKGEVEVWITALIELKWAEEFAKNKWLRRFTDIFKERLLHHDIIVERKRELYREAYILQNYIKQWFKLKRFLPYEEVEPFPPSGAFPTYTRGE